MTYEYHPRLNLDASSRGYRYFRNAVERHWDPHDIDLSEDREAITKLEKVSLDQLRTTLGLFGAGEQAVTEDLSPLAQVLEDVNDQMFITTQMYEEAKHTDFFDRYWREVIHHAENEMGLELSSPTEERWFNEDYDELFRRNRETMYGLLDDDGPENRAKAYCHYHLVIEGILAQTGYYGVQKSFSGDFSEIPELPGLVEGFTLIRGDEGRHIGFGMAKLKNLVESGRVEASLLHGTVNELIPLTQGIIDASGNPDSPGVKPDELSEYASEKHVERMNQIANVSEDIPDLDELTRIAGD